MALVLVLFVYRLIACTYCSIPCDRYETSKALVVPSVEVSVLYYIVISTDLENLLAPTLAITCGCDRARRNICTESLGVQYSTP